MEENKKYFLENGFCKYPLLNNDTLKIAQEIYDQAFSSEKIKTHRHDLGDHVKKQGNWLKLFSNIIILKYTETSCRPHIRKFFISFKNLYQFSSRMQSNSNIKYESLNRPKPRKYATNYLAL